jgi:uncharacterized membrane protein
MSKEKRVTKGIIYVILALLFPTITWIIFQIVLDPSEYGINIWGIGYSFAFIILFPLIIIISIVLLIVGISYLIPNLNKNKKEVTVRKCKVCGFEVPAGENTYPDCMVLN